MPTARPGQKPPRTPQQALRGKLKLAKLQKLSELLKALPQLFCDRYRDRLESDLLYRGGEAINACEEYFNSFLVEIGKDPYIDCWYRGGTPTTEEAAKTVTACFRRTIGARHLVISSRSRRRMAERLCQWLNGYRVSRPPRKRQSQWRRVLSLAVTPDIGPGPQCSYIDAAKWIDEDYYGFVPRPRYFGNPRAVVTLAVRTNPSIRKRFENELNKAKTGT